MKIAADLNTLWPKRHSPAEIIFYCETQEHNQVLLTIMRENRKKVQTKRCIIYRPVHISHQAAKIAIKINFMKIIETRCTSIFLSNLLMDVDQCKLCKLLPILYLNPHHNHYHKIFAKLLLIL